MLCGEEPTVEMVLGKHKAQHSVTRRKKLREKIANLKHPVRSHYPSKPAQAGMSVRTVQ